jgi:hypothetical protein
MGHVRLGKPPATRKWREVVALLDESEFKIDDIASAVERSSDRSLSQAVNDPGFVEALWLLLQIPVAVSERDAAAALLAIGLEVPDEPMLDDILAAFGEAVDRTRQNGGRAVTDFSLIGRNAALTALASLARDLGPSLWRATLEDQRLTLATFASGENFGELAQRFFTHVLEGHLHYFLDREIPRHIGRGGIMRSVGDTGYFEGELRRHCRESTLIMRTFARDWLGKNRFHLGKELTRKDVAGFAAFAFTKVRNELSRRSGLAA